MAIQVTCPGCHTRFTVGDQHAGKKGPCPKCKKTIEIPSADQKVEVHAPEDFGPRDREGRSVLKPVFRKETKLSSVQIVAIVASVVLAIAAAVAVRFSGTEPDSTQMWVILSVGAVMLAPVLAFAGYTFLRDQDLEPHRGSNLWIRIGICGAGFALIWLAWPLAAYTLGDYELMPIAIATAAMVGLGAGISFVTLELDYIMGLLHYGLYFVVCILLRFICDVGFIPLVSEG